MPTGRPRKPADGKPSTASLRKLARAHTAVALQVLAEVATHGNSEASRISAAMALLDRGYGKSGNGASGGDEGRAPTLYQRIELIDGTEDEAAREHQAQDRHD